MTADLGDLVNSLTASEALKFVCLFLAQNDEPEAPHVELDFATQNEAFERVGEVFDTKPRTAQNERDAFDRFTNSSRAGWDKPLPPRLIPIFEQYGDLAREDMRHVSREILAKDWSKAMGVLPDLKVVRKDLKVRLAKYDVNAVLKIDPVLWEDIVHAYDVFRSDTVRVVGNHSLQVKTPERNHLSISGQEFRQVWACLPYARALMTYREVCNDLAKELGFKNRAEGKKYFKKMPRPFMPSSEKQEVDDAIKRLFPNSTTDQDLLSKFVVDQDWSGVTKTLERNDWLSSAIESAGNWLREAASRRGSLTEALAKDLSFETRLEAVLNAAKVGPAASTPVSVRIEGGINFVNYGAPGTGKSHKISEEARNLGIVPITTVFHPDVQNSDFVGTLKPVVTAGDVGYAFSPGPFLKAYVKAWRNPGHPVWFVIEELNRAPAAAVFGELFLLLDREGNGSGKYHVDYPSLECEAWVNENIPETITDRPDRLKLPSNLTIAATLNSADQGVYPLDTAFRRRWTQNYVKLDYTQGPDKVVKFVDKDGVEQEVDWREFVRSLNGVMESHGIREDRLLGPWFASEHELDSGAIPGKVLVYLWDDLFRNHDKSVVFSHKGSTYGGLVDAIENGKPIFSDALLTALTEAADI